MASGMRKTRPATQRKLLNDTVEWNETAGMAERHMRLSGVESLTVVADDRPIGRITRRDIERCENYGNWLEAVIVLDLVQEPRDTCN